MSANDIGVRLYENGNYWKAFWLDAAGKEHSKSLGSMQKLTKRQALQKCHAIATQHMVQPSSMTGEQAPTLKGWTDHFMATRTDLTEGGRTMYRHTIKFLIQHFGEDQRIDTIDKFSARLWHTWLGKSKEQEGLGLAEATVCLHVRKVQALFSMAVDDEIIARNPFSKLKGTPPEMEKLWPELSDADVQRLVDAANSHEWRALVGLLGWAGLRRGEALRLTWQDIQWERNRLIVRPVGGRVTTKQRTREVLMIEPLAKLLLDVREMTQGDRPAAVSNNNLQRTMQALIKRAGFPIWKKTFHALRKSRATMWRVKYPESVVDSWLGHSLAVARKHYAKVPEQFYGADELTKAKAEIDRLNALLERMTPEQTK